jgi:biopolymer transport protein ExbD
MSGGGGAPAPESGPKKNTFGETELQGVSLNLTALMDILSNLLFFLLASFGATVVMAINTQVPAQSSDKSDVADTGESVTVNLKLVTTGIEVTANGSQQNETDMSALARTIPNVDGKLDAKSLSDHLFIIKTKYPKSDTVIMTPEPGVKYEAMIQTMDASRERNVTTAGQTHTVPLFPTVVISTIVK